MYTDFHWSPNTVWYWNYSHVEYPQWLIYDDHDMTNIIFLRFITIKHVLVKDSNSRSKVASYIYSRELSSTVSSIRVGFGVWRFLSNLNAVLRHLTSGSYPTRVTWTPTVTRSRFEKFCDLARNDTRTKDVFFSFSYISNHKLLFLDIVFL